MKVEMEIHTGEKRKAIDSKLDRFFYTVNVMCTLVMVQFAYTAFMSKSYWFLFFSFVFGLIGMNDICEYVTKGNRVK